MGWNYTSNDKRSSGYEGVIDILKQYTPLIYNNSTPEQKDKMVNSVFDIYRSINIYPITYYNDDGIKEEIEKCIDKNVVLENNTIDFKLEQGLSLCRYLFPNLEKVIVRGVRENSMYDRFYNDDKLKKAISLRLITRSPTPANMLSALRLVGGGVGSNFHPMRAKAIYEKYSPPKGVIYDYACGFGGRMLGALSSKNEYTFFGVEPNTETFLHLNELGRHIEKVTGRENSYNIYCEPSETYFLEDNYFDFAFSSPPYFNLEEYSTENTQSYIKYPTLDLWFSNYVTPTISNIYKMLKPNSYYGVNIADFKVRRKKIELVSRWVEISKSIGFKYVETIDISIQRRKGDGHKDHSGTPKNKKEAIFIFKKY